MDKDKIEQKKEKLREAKEKLESYKLYVLYLQERVNDIQKELEKEQSNHV